MRLIAAALVATVAASSLSAQTPEVLLRVDDIGMSHSVNMALEKLAATKAPASASILVVCPWYQESVEILRKNPQISVGVHLALNAEWKGFRWGPVLGKEAVPSLVDTVGYFLPSTREFLASKYDLREVERELSAQVERAMRTGLKIDYVDYHMGTAVATPELRAVVERVAEKYGVGISRYYGEKYKTLFDTPVAEKERDLLSHVGRLTPGTLNLVVVHMAEWTPEIGVLVDMNNAEQNSAGGEPQMGRHRAAELAALLSPEFAKVRASGRVKLVTYRDVIAKQGRAGMKRPIQ